MIQKQSICFSESGKNVQKVENENCVSRSISEAEEGVRKTDTGKTVTERKDLIKTEDSNTPQAQIGSQPVGTDSDGLSLFESKVNQTVQQHTKEDLMIQQQSKDLCESAEIIPGKDIQRVENENRVSDSISKVEEADGKTDAGKTETGQKDLVKAECSNTPQAQMGSQFESKVDQKVQHQQTQKEIAHQRVEKESSSSSSSSSCSSSSSEFSESDDDESNDLDRRFQAFSLKKKGEQQPGKQSLQQRLKALNDSISTALVEVVNEGQDLDHYTDLLLDNRDKVKKRLQEHRMFVLGLVEQAFQLQMDDFKNTYQKLIQQIFLSKTEGKNHEALLADLQRQLVEELYSSGAEEPAELSSSSSSKQLTDHRLQYFTDSFLHLQQKKPVVQMAKRTVEAHLPEVAVSDLQSLMGRVVLEDKDPVTDVPEQCQQSQQSWTGVPEPQQQFHQAQQSRNGAPSQTHAPLLNLPERSASQIIGQYCTQFGTALQGKTQTSRVSEGKGKKSASAPRAERWLQEGKGTLVFHRRSFQKPSRREKEIHPIHYTEEQLKAGRKVIALKCKELEALKNASASRVPSAGWESVTTPTDSSPTHLSCSRSNIACIAPRPDGKAWVTYLNEGTLDLLDDKGTVHQSTTVGCRPEFVAAYGPTDAIVANTDSRKCLMLWKDGDKGVTLFKGKKYKALAVTTTGIAISVCDKGPRIHWMPFGGHVTWVTVPGVKVASIISLSILTYKGKIVICAADIGRRLVHFFQLEDSGKFSAYPSFGFEKAENFLNKKTLKKMGRHKEQPKFFKPVSVSAHPSGFVAVLDGTLGQVLFINTRNLFEYGLNGSQCATSIIAWDHVTYGMPHMIAFSASENDKPDESTLWVATKKLGVVVTPLLFLPW